jgi:hypothetical protein
MVYFGAKQRNLFFDKGNILILQRYQLHTTSAPIRCPKTSRMHTTKKKIKKREIQNKDPVALTKH